MENDTMFYNTYTHARACTNTHTHARTHPRAHTHAERESERGRRETYIQTDRDTERERKREINLSSVRRLAWTFKVNSNLISNVKQSLKWRFTFF